MAAQYILVIMGSIFLALALARIARDHGHIPTTARTWLIIALIFGAVGLWLWTGNHG